LSSGEEVTAFGQELQRIVQFLEVSEAQMQMGHMRFEPNINVHITDQDGNIHKTAITEIKNLNSFSVLERATGFEIRRQIETWEDSGSLGKKSTYGWDEGKQATFHQRDKEEANDYRYFPDPDLVPVEIDDGWLTELKSQISELPAVRRIRYVEVLGLSQADAVFLASDRPTGDFFEASLQAAGGSRRVANLILTHGRRLANERSVPLSKIGVSPQRFAEVALMIDQNKISVSSATAIFDRLATNDAPPESIANDLGLIQVSDTGAIDAAIDKVIAENPKAVADFKGGKQAALGSLTGAVMKSAKGLNPKMVQEALRKRLMSP
jgi:aspartyl-tRNA(Asn)/glutamyl-tRNA(Gln) amidotransferase subunit B